MAAFLLIKTLRALSF